MKDAGELIIRIYVYCTDFIIRMAHLTGTSYYEVNAVIFCVLWPLLTFGLIIWWLWLKRKVSAGSR